MLALALVLALGADSPRFATRQCPRGEGGRSTRGIPCGAAEEPTYLEFMAASGAGLPVISHHNTALCDALAAEVPTWGALTGGGVGWPVWDSGTLYTGANTVVSHAGSTWRCPAGNCTPGTTPGVSPLWTNVAGAWQAANYATSATVYHLSKTWICSGAACSFSEVPGTAADWTQLSGAWCLGGDGLAVTGSQVTFALVGTPAVIDTPVCPSGLDCLAATGLPVKALHTGNPTGSNTRSTTAIGNPGSVFSTCGWYSDATGIQTGGIVSNAKYSTSTVGFSMRNNYAFVAKNGGANTGVTLTGPLQGGPSLVCMTYRFVADGTSILSGYTNGSLSQSVSNAVGPVQTSLTEYVVGREEWGGTSMSGNMFGAFYVDQELTSAQIAAISRRVLADVPKAVIRGGQSYVDMTYSRTGSRFCAKADNTGSIVPANRPCISQSGYLSEAAGTNSALRSQQINSAPWNPYAVTVAVPTVTADYGLAPDSTKTAERVQIPEVTASQASVIFQGGVFTNVTSTASLGVRGNGTSGTMDLCVQTASGYSCQPCAYVASAETVCTASATAGGAQQIIFGNMGSLKSPAAASAAHDIIVWRAQAEVGPVATSYIPTTSAAASRGADLGYFIGLAPSKDPSVSGCMAATFGLPSLFDNAILNLTATANGIGLLGVYNQNATTFGAFRTTAIALRTVTLDSSNRGVTSWVGGSYSVSFDGAAVAASGAAPASNFTVLQVGDYNGVHAPNTRISGVQFDPRPSRCR